MLMKTTTFTASLVAGLLALAWATPALAADKELTLHGEAKCAKCALKETAKCQTVIQVKDHGKTVNYYLTANDAAKKFHHSVCSETKEVTATGKDKVVNGKHEFTATKIDLAKK